MSKRIPVLATLVAVLVLTTGCAEPPEETMLQADQALQTARDAEAETYAAEELRDARLALEEAQLEVQTQNERFAIMRDYEDAIKGLENAAQQADATREKADAEKEANRLQAETLLQQARQAVTDADGSLEKAPRGKGTKADIAALSADLDAVRNEIPALEAQISGEEYFGAQDKASSVIAAAQAISQEIEAAVEMQAKILAKRHGQ